MLLLQMMKRRKKEKTDDIFDEDANIRSVFGMLIPHFKDADFNDWYHVTGVVLLKDLNWMEPEDYKSIPFPLIQRKAAINVINFFKEHGFVVKNPTQVKEWADNNNSNGLSGKEKRDDWHMLVKSKEKLCNHLIPFQVI